jgi:hypothetical protein
MVWLHCFDQYRQRALEMTTSTLCPAPESKDEATARKALRHIVRKVVASAATYRSESDIMLEVYLAGMWHGLELSGPPKRKPDYLEIKSTPARRGRPRKDQLHD